MRLQFRQVDLDDLVEVFFRFGITFGIAGQVMRWRLLHMAGDLRAAGGFEIAGHAFIVAKNRSRGANFSAHIADGTFAGSAHALGAGTKIFHDGAGAAL